MSTREQLKAYWITNHKLIQEDYYDLLDSVRFKGEVIDDNTLIIEKTYAELKALADSSSLSVENVYKITNYRTIHFIDGLTPGSLISLPSSWNTTSPVEPLYVKAFTSTRLYKEAFSELHPNDIIHYELNPTDFDQSVFGKIIYREDTVNKISAHYDWRNFKFARWQTIPDSGIYDSPTIKSGTYQTPTTFDSLYSYYNIKIESGEITSPYNVPRANNIVFKQSGSEVLIYNETKNLHISTTANNKIYNKNEIIHLVPETIYNILTGGGEANSLHTHTINPELLNGKADLVDGKVPDSQLPSYIDDVLEYATFGGFPSTGEPSKLYVDKEYNLSYRWSGTMYIEVSSSLINLLAGPSVASGHISNGTQALGGLKYFYNNIAIGNIAHSWDTDYNAIDIGRGSLYSLLDNKISLIHGAYIGINGLTATATSGSEFIMSDEFEFKGIQNAVVGQEPFSETLMKLDRNGLLSIGLITPNIYDKLAVKGTTTLAEHISTGVNDITINPSLKESGNFISAEISGLQKFIIDYTGKITNNNITRLTPGESYTIDTGYAVAFGNSSELMITGWQQQTEGTHNFVDIRPNYLQSSGDANNTDLRILRTELLTGTGEQLLIDAICVDTKFKVDTTGTVTIGKKLVVPIGGSVSDLTLTTVSGSSGIFFPYSSTIDFVNNNIKSATFSADGNLLIGTDIDWNVANPIQVERTHDTAMTCTIKNASSGVNAQASVQLKSSSNKSITMSVTSPNLTPTGLYRPDMAYIYSTCTDGLSFMTPATTAIAADAPIRFSTLGSERVKINSTGELIAYKTVQCLNGSSYALFGGNSGSDGTISNNTTKATRIGMPNYSGAAGTPITMFLGSSGATAHLLNIGGGTSVGYACNTISFYTGATTSTLTGTERMTISSTGNVGISYSGIPTNIMLGIGATPTAGSSTYSVMASGYIQPNSVDGHSGFATWLSTAASVFTIGALTHFNAIQITIGAGSTVVSQYGFKAGSTLSGATTNIGFVSEIVAKATNWNIYASGTAKNYFAGNVLIGTPSDNTVDKLQVLGSVSVSGAFSATTKSFIIKHPTKEGKTLRYGSLESPYHGVRLTGEAKLVKGKCVINLPDYIHGLVKKEGAQVQITNIKHNKVIWVEDIDIDNDMITVKANTWWFDKKEYSFYWSFTAIRKDVEDMEVES